MALSSKTLRPGLLVSLKTTIRGNVDYIKKNLSSEGAEIGADEGAAVARWETTRIIADPKEHEAAKKARSAACVAIRSCCKYSAFGLLCPETDAEKLEAGIKQAREIAEEFNKTAELTRISIYVLTGKVSPDDVEAVRALGSEVRELMSEMANGIQGNDADAIRDAASRLKGVSKMLSVEAQTKAQLAIDTARSAARTIKKTEGKGEVDKSAIRKINDFRAAFLDLDDAEEIAAPAAKAAAQLDLAAE